MKWYVGSDHAGFHLKGALIAALRALGDEIVDFGADADQPSVDYPDYAAKVGKAVAGDPAGLGLLCCGSGIGVSIAANKVHGVRAAVVSESYSAKMARLHNDANVLCLGERMTGVGIAEECVRAFRDAHFEGGRHQRRVDKITALDAQRDT
jgi:ribose 5-phosphate isomerase B